MPVAAADPANPMKCSEPMLLANREAPTCWAMNNCKKKLKHLLISAACIQLAWIFISASYIFDTLETHELSVLSLVYESVSI